MPTAFCVRVEGALGAASRQQAGARQPRFRRAGPARIWAWHGRPALAVACSTTIPAFSSSDAPPASPQAGGAGAGAARPGQPPTGGAASWAAGHGGSVRAGGAHAHWHVPGPCIAAGQAAGPGGRAQRLTCGGVSEWLVVILWLSSFQATAWRPMRMHNPRPRHWLPGLHADSPARLPRPRRSTRAACSCSCWRCLRRPRRPPWWTPWSCPTWDTSSSSPAPGCGSSSWRQVGVPACRRLLLVPRLMPSGSCRRTLCAAVACAVTSPACWLVVSQHSLSAPSACRPLPAAVHHCILHRRLHQRAAGRGGRVWRGRPPGGEAGSMLF